MLEASRILEHPLVATNRCAASQAWVWLGESADSIDLAMDILNSVSTMRIDDLDYQPDPYAWEAINCLFKRQWWTRLWVVQEILLAKGAIVHCGEKAVDIEKFVQFKAMESRYRRRNGPRLQSILSPMSHILWDWRRVKDSIAKNRLTLFELISMTGESKCQEKKDNIFALLGLCTAKERKYFSSDYHLPDRSLMVKVAQYFMNTRELQSPIKFLQTHQDGKTVSLPSWVPDFTSEDVAGHLMIPMIRGYTPYKAGADNDAWTRLGLPPLAPEILRRRCMNTFGPTLGLILGIIFGYISWLVTRRMNSASARFGDVNSDETLVLGGLKVDLIGSASKMPMVEYYTGTDLEEDIERKRKRRETTIATCQEWEQHVQTMNLEINPYATLHGRREAFWRTLIADRDFDSKGPPNPSHDFAGRFEAWIGKKGRSTNVETYTRPFSDAAIWRCVKRSFITTKKGYLGLAPWGAHEGDVVCVLRGGDVPFVLREKEDGYWKLVGEAYVHGIMDGSWVRNAVKEDVMDFKII